MTEKEKELYNTAEAASAIQLAKNMLNTAETKEMEPEERQEFERMKQMVETANFVEHPPRPPLGTAASIWLNFMEAYMRTVLYHHEELKKEIESTFERAKKRAE